MKFAHSLSLLAGTLLLAAGALAEDVVDASQVEADVWEVIESAWNAAENGDREWTDKWLADDFSGWNTAAPVPRSKSSVRMWDRFQEQEGSMVAHELYPYRITVRSDVAVAHYFYSSAFKAKDGTISRDNGRFTDVLVRTADGWKFLAWHGGDDD